MNRLEKSQQPDGTFIIKYYYEDVLVATVNTTLEPPAEPLTADNVDQVYAYLMADLGIDTGTE